MPRKKKDKENRDPSFTIGTGYTRRTGGYDPNKDKRDQEGTYDAERLENLCVQIGNM